MRRFSHFLFENFDPEAHSANPRNPRNFLNAEADAVLSHVARFPARSCPAKALPRDVLSPLLEGGILRLEDGFLLYDTPVFLKEDAAPLQDAMSRSAHQITDQLLPAVPALRRCCAGLNPFSAEENLYHLLCGMVFDGLFFDYLSRREIVAISRPHASGLDYLSVIYEQCPQLDTFSDGLLCSYNRCTDGRTSLQSFGDANGDRFDFYRVSRQLEAGKQVSCPPLPETPRLLAQVQELILHGHCDPDIMTLLETFGYAKEGSPCVPVYGPEAQAAALELEAIVEAQVGDAFAEALSVLPDITAVRHGVSAKELANELYHILFGSVNEALAARGIVAAPTHIPGEGRYLRCIQLDF